MQNNTYFNINIYKLSNLQKKSLNFTYLFNFFFNRNIQIFFSKKTNKIFLQENNIIIRLFFVNLFFFKTILNESKNINFLFIKLKKFYSFFINLINVYNTTKNLYFFRLKLRGLGFVLKRYSKFLFSFVMAVNHFYYFFVPDFFFIKKKKKHIICLSIDNIRLNILFWHLLFIKKHNVYVRTKKLNGFIKNNFIRFIRKKYKL